MTRRHLIAVAINAVTCLVSVVLAAAPFTMTSLVPLTDVAGEPAGVRELDIRCERDGEARYVTATGARRFFDLTEPTPDAPRPICEGARRSRRVGAALLMTVAAMVGYALVRRRADDDLLDGQQVAEPHATGAPGGVEPGQ